MGGLLLPIAQGAASVDEKATELDRCMAELEAVREARAAKPSHKRVLRRQRDFIFGRTAPPPELTEIMAG